MVNWTEVRKVTMAFASALVLGATTEQSFALNCDPLKENKNVVEVSTDGKARSGSGVLLTFDGYVVTAAHLFLQDLDGPVPLLAHVRLLGNRDYQPARLVRIDKEIDLALLKLNEVVDGFVGTPPADATALGGATPVTEICLAGFGIFRDSTGKPTENSFKSYSATIKGDQSGYILADDTVLGGYSGGAAFTNGTLLGIILGQVSPYGTFIIPASYVIEFVAPEGLVLESDRTFKAGKRISELYQLSDANRKNIIELQSKVERILRSMDWDLAIKNVSSIPSTLVLTPKRSFPAQIIKDGLFAGKLYAHFSVPVEANEADPRPYADISKPLNSDSSIIVDLSEKIDVIMRWYRSMGVDLSQAHIESLEIEIKILYDGGQSDPLLKTVEMPPDAQ